jgi:hypothetical protein
MNSRSLTKYETSPTVMTYPPVTARALEVSVISRETILIRCIKMYPDPRAKGAFAREDSVTGLRFSLACCQEAYVIRPKLQRQIEQQRGKMGGSRRLSS